MLYIIKKSIMCKIWRQSCFVMFQCQYIQCIDFKTFCSDNHTCCSGDNNNSDYNSDYWCCPTPEVSWCVSVTVTVTVTEALVLRPLLEDRGRITESIRNRVLVPVDRMKQKCFHITTKQVRRSQQFQLYMQFLDSLLAMSELQRIPDMRPTILCGPKLRSMLEKLFRVLQFQIACVIRCILTA